MRSLVSTPVNRLRRRVVREAEGLFSHADDPLADTSLYAGDPGLFGPGSITWELMGDASTFIGGIRALLVQAAHPEVVAGVAAAAWQCQASRCREWDRLARRAADAV